MSVDISFELITEDDIARLTPVMTRAFDDDSRKHLGVEKGGPEGYNNGDFFRKWLFGYNESTGYKMVLSDRIIGAFIVWIHHHGHNVLGNIFVDPDYQDQGAGTRAWTFIEQTYPNTKSWSLDTPRWATKNHHFYEHNCGFTKTGENEQEFHYRKNIGIM